MSERDGKLWGIILAGGDGKRLQSFVRERFGCDVPKQYCTFTGTRSMLRHTIDRAEMLIQPKRLLTIVSKTHFRYAEAQLADRPKEMVLIQPIARETGPAILYPLLHVYQRDSEATVCLFPSDHFVLNEQSFMKYIEFSAEYVATNPQSIALLGAIPQKPDSGYGWIVTGDQVAGKKPKRMYRVSKFVEKPDVLTAYLLYHKGSLWNTMVIVCKVKVLLAMFKKYAPATYQALWEVRDVLGSMLEKKVLEEVFARISPVNFSYSILEKNPKGLRTLQIEGVYWSDWGKAARIEADIARYCRPRSSPVTSLPIPESFGETVLVPQIQDS